MGRMGNAVKLFREFVGFARASRNYWLIPLVVLLAIAAALVVVGQTATPLLYTLF